MKPKLKIDDRVRAMESCTFDKDKSTPNWRAGVVDGVDVATGPTPWYLVTFANGNRLWCTEAQVQPATTMQNPDDAELEREVAVLQGVRPVMARAMIRDPSLVATAEFIMFSARFKRAIDYMHNMGITWEQEEEVPGQREWERTHRPAKDLDPMIVAVSAFGHFRMYFYDEMRRLRVWYDNNPDAPHYYACKGTMAEIRAWLKNPDIDMTFDILHDDGAP